MARPHAAAAAAIPAEAPPPPTPPVVQALRGLLQAHWGHDAFRALQVEAVASTLRGQDALVILPTGGGKSLTFQLAPLYQNRITVVVTPLLALAKDQVNACLERGIEAGSWSSETPENVRVMLAKELLADAEDTTLRLLYTTPESLGTERLQELLKGAHECGKLCSLAIDEAHAVSEWGHDFRPAYLALGDLRAEFKGLPIIACTATATSAVKQSIISLLQLKDPLVLQGSFNRPNIRYEVRYKELIGDGGREEVLQDLLAFLAERRGQCGIIYARLRATCDWLAGQLGDADIDCAAYHAGKDSQQRSKIQSAWSEGDYDLVVSTVAFGMGIDRSCVRYVVHWDPPASMEGMYQESGRAGRDGQPSLSLLYASNQELKDAKRMERGVRQGAVGGVAAYIQEPRCRRRALLSYFEERRGGGCSEAAGEQVCDFCRDPKAVLAQLARLERKLEAAAPAAAAAAGADPFDRCDPGSGAEEGGGQQQHGAKRRRSSSSSAGGEAGSDVEGAGAAAVDPFASARAMEHRPAAVPGRAAVGGGTWAQRPPMAGPRVPALPRPGGVAALPAMAAAAAVAAATAAGGASQLPAIGRQPLRPVLPNRNKRLVGMGAPLTDKAQQQSEDAAAQAAAPPIASPNAAPAVVGSAGTGSTSLGALPASAPAALGGAAPRTGAQAPAAVGGGSASAGGKKPVFRSFKAPRRLEVPGP